MDKLKLTAKEKVIFQAAMQAAYDGGSQDATFLANSMYKLVDGPQKILARVTKQFCEDEDAPEVSENEANTNIQKPSSRYREAGDGHDELS